MSEPPPKVTKSERALLRQLAQEAWEAELDDKLEQLFEDFSRWADDGMSAFELSDRIHEFHNGASRELYSRYTGLDSVTAVARAIALGILDEGALGDTLRMKLSAQIEAFRSNEVQ
jgi:hypothetical protein